MIYYNLIINTHISLTHATNCMRMSVNISIEHNETVLLLLAYRVNRLIVI